MVVLGKPVGHVVIASTVGPVIAGAGQVLSCLALAYASGFAAVIGGVLALSVASAVSVPTRQALLPAMVARADLPRASAIGQSAGSVGMMIGPALAGLLVGGVGPQQTVRLAALGFLATIVGGLTIGTRRGGPAPASSAGSADSSAEPDVAWTLRRDPLLWSSVWGLTAVIAAISAVNVVLVFFIIGTLHSSAQIYGVVDSMWTVGLLVGAWLFSQAIKPQTNDAALARRLFVAVGLVSVAIVAVGSVPDAWWIVPCFLFGGAQNGGLNVWRNPDGAPVPAPARGRANAAWGCAFRRVRWSASSRRLLPNWRSHAGSHRLRCLGDYRGAVLPLVAKAARAAVRRTNTPVGAPVA
jgi:MFS family permease